MTSEEAVRLTRAHIEGQFPKVCASCGTRYENLAAYVRNTEHVGLPVSFDAEVGDLRPKDSAGTVALANCRCGNTLAISSAGIPLKTLWRLMWWGRKESRRRGISFNALLAWVRAEIDRQVLEEAK